MDHGYDLLLLENQVCFPAYAVANKILRRYQPLLKKLDLTYTQYVTMMVLWEKGAAHEKDLVKALYLQANTLTSASSATASAPSGGMGLRRMPPESPG